MSSAAPIEISGAAPAKKSTSYLIELQSPNKIIEGEKNAKLITPESKLRIYLTGLREKLQKDFSKEMDCKPLHTDLSLNLDPKLNKMQKAEAINKRATIIHKMKVDVSDSANWGFMGVGNQAFVLWLPELDSGTEFAVRPHITIGYFRFKGKTCVPETLQTRIKSYIVTD